MPAKTTVIRWFWIGAFVGLCQACGNAYRSTEVKARMEAYIEELKLTGMSAEAFAVKLAQMGLEGTEEELLRGVPTNLMRDFPELSALVLKGEDSVKGSDKEKKGEKVPPAFEKGSALIGLIAAGHSDLWSRNVLEWIALKHANSNLRKNYRTVRICVGANATWGCFADQLETVGAYHEEIDLFVQAQGAYDASGPYAIDDFGTSTRAAELLASKWVLKYRMGFFLSPFSAKGQGGFPQVFMELGGEAALGSEGVSPVMGDLMIVAEMGAKGRRLGEAVSVGNRTPVDWYSKQWASGGAFPLAEERSGDVRVTVGDLNMKIRAR